MFRINQGILRGFRVCEISVSIRSFDVFFVKIGDGFVFVNEFLIGFMLSFFIFDGYGQNLGFA